MNVEIKTLPDFSLAYVRHIGPYGPEIGPAWHRVFTWAGENGLIHPEVKAIGISWDNPEFTPPAQCRYDACIVVPAGTEKKGINDAGISWQTLSGGLHACYRRPTAENEYAEAMNELFGIWLPQSGYECVGTPFEFYHDSMNNIKTPGEPWDVSFCMPVKKL